MTDYKWYCWQYKQLKELHIWAQIVEDDVVEGYDLLQICAFGYIYEIVE